MNAPGAIYSLAAALIAGDRAALGRAITLVESTLPEHQVQAQALLAEVLPRAGGSIHVGITGVPGVGKSSLIERLGLMLLERGHRVAVLAVDPSSQVSGGSILGDKTRMAGLARHDGAFVRPSPAGGTLGGVAGRTRESISLLEAAGYDIVLVETVGVGQSETVVAGMVDCFLVLILPGAGDELQGVKRGIMELADVVAVTKADGDNLARAKLARAQLQAALHLLSARYQGWTVPVLTCSAVDGSGLPELWDAVVDHRRHLGEAGLLEPLRRRQARQWFQALVDEGLRAALLAGPEVVGLMDEAAAEVESGRISPQAGAARVLAAVGGG
ncbi:MAG: methylmalonyl Co-A mutase-associated GTPase MeaB [Anaerolineae bacterium]